MAQASGRGDVGRRRAAGAALALPQVAIDVGREAFSLLAAQRVSLPHIGMALALLGVGTWSAAAYALRQD